MRISFGFFFGRSNFIEIVLSYEKFHYLSLLEYYGGVLQVGSKGGKRQNEFCPSIFSD